MFDLSFDRLLSYRLAAVSDCWGQSRRVRIGARHGVWFLDPSGLDEPLVASQPPSDDEETRRQKLEAFAASGRFTPCEIATLHALVVERLTINEIAERDRCSRQAVIARIVGNTRRQGGLLRKALAANATSTGETS